MIRMLPLVLSLGLGSGCGWHFGTAPLPALSVAPIDASTVEPSLRAALHAAVEDRLAEIGARSDGPALQIEVLTWNQAPDAAIPGVRAGNVAYETRGSIAWKVPARPGCDGAIDARGTWVDSGGGSVDPAVDRDRGNTAVASEIARRLVDAIAATPPCRAPRVTDPGGAHP